MSKVIFYCPTYSNRINVCKSNFQGQEHYFTQSFASLAKRYCVIDLQPEFNLLGSRLLLMTHYYKEVSMYLNPKQIP